MVAFAGSPGQLHGRRGTAVNSPPKLARTADPERRRSDRIGRCSAIAGRDPRDAAKADALIGEITRLVLARLAIDAVRIDLTVVDAAGLLGKAAADVIAIG